MKQNQNNQKNKNCGNKNCGSKNCGKNKSSAQEDGHSYSHGGNND
jgi:hypothetical protein